MYLVHGVWILWMVIWQYNSEPAFDPLSCVIPKSEDVKSVSVVCRHSLGSDQVRGDPKKVSVVLSVFCARVNSFLGRVRYETVQIGNRKQTAAIGTWVETSDSRFEGFPSPFRIRCWCERLPE